MPFSVWDGPCKNIKVSRSEDLSWVEVAANLRVIGSQVMDRPKRDLPQMSFSHAKLRRDTSIPALHALVFDFDLEALVANAPAFWWAFEYATLFYETSSSRVVTEDNPLGLPRGRLVVPAARGIPKDQFKAFAKLLAEAFAENTGLKLDIKATSNLVWFTGPRRSAAAPPRNVDWTPGFAFDFQKAIQFLPQPAPVVVAAPKPRRSPAGSYNHRAFIDKALLRARDAIANAPNGSRNKDTFRELSRLAQLINQGLTVAEITEVSLASKLPARERNATLKSALKAGQRKPYISTATVIYDVPTIRAETLTRARTHGLKPRELALVTEIVTVMDVVTGFAIVTRETLAERTGLTVFSITRMVRRLVARGVLEVDRARRPHPKRAGSTFAAPNHYRIRAASL